MVQFYNISKCKVSRLICIVLGCLLLTACGGNSADSLQTEPSGIVTSTISEQANTEENYGEKTEVRLLDQDGKAVYRIVRADEGTDTEINAGIDLNKALKEMTGVSFTLTNDFLTSQQSIDDVAEVYEILVGVTNRPESQQAKQELSDNEYIIRVTEYKIVIVGSNDAATYQALQAFVAMIRASESFSLSKITDVKAEFKSQGYLVALTNQGESMLEVYDISSGKLDASTRVWSYKLKYYNVAGTKLRHSDTYGDVALAVCGSSYGCMISYPEGKLLWQTEAAANNPHSIELMPNGVIAIASSTGAEIRFFTTKSKTSAKPAATVTFDDAHGVLWDDQNQILWAIGRNVLTAYRVTLNANDTVTVTEDTSRRAAIPSDYAHDIAPVYGDSNELWITTSSHVYRFDKTTKTFSTGYSGHNIVDISNVKGIGNFDDGSIIFIYPDGKFKSWTSESMILVRNQNGKLVKQQLTSATGDFYKIRVWDIRYQ